MILLVDVGNSRIKWTTQQGQRLDTGRAALWSLESLEKILDMEWGGLAPPAAIWIANVAGPGVADRLAAWAQKHFNCTPNFVRATSELGGVRNSYREPMQLGVDRLIAMVAAHHRYQCSVCVVDCGTAATMDLLDANGVFRGGVIAPGNALMRQALSHRTYALPSTQLINTSACARSTEDGIAAGCLLALTGMIERTYREFLRTNGEEELACVITGGEAPLVLPMLSISCDHDADLVLRGLAVLAGGER